MNLATHSSPRSPTIKSVLFHEANAILTTMGTMPSLSAPLHPVLDTIGLDANHWNLEQASKAARGGEITSKRGAHHL